MLTFYLAALIFGLGSFLVQMFASGGAAAHDALALPDADLGHGGSRPLLGDLPLEGGHLDAGHPVDAGHPAGAGHPAAGGPVDAGWASIFVSLRFYMFAALGLGAVGAPATAFDLSGPGLTFGVALATAFGVGTLASLGFRLLGRDTLSSGATGEELVGQLGRVLVPCEKARVGKVRLTVRGQTIDFVATTDEERLALGAGVLVLSVNAERVHVCAAPRELLPD